MIPDEISHLEDNSRSPFDALIALDQTIAIARLAHITLLHRLTYDAVRDDSEQLFSDAMSYLWAARQAFRDMAEAES